MTSRMNERKFGDDKQDYCQHGSVDYVLDSVQALKALLRNGRQRPDDKGLERSDLKGIWSHSLHRSPTVTPLSMDVEISNVSLMRMQDAKLLLTSLLVSLDDAINEVTVKNCRTTRPNLVLLPEDVLIRIFEIYVDMSVMPDYDTYVPLGTSPLILSSVCKRFREIILRLPSAWRHISLNFPEHVLLLHKERCTNPIIHINPARSTSYTYEKMLDVIRPYHQWRELRLHVINEDHAHQYFEHLKPIIHSPFYSLEFLSIGNDLSFSLEDSYVDYPFSIYLDEDHSNFLSSWRLPKLTHLELRNVLPTSLLQCENVTSLSLELSYVDEELRMKEFQTLFHSMPKIQSLSVVFKKHFESFDDEDVLIDDDILHILPSLKSLDLTIEGPMPDGTLSRFMALVDARKLTRFALSVSCDDADESDFGEWIFAIFPKQTARTRHLFEHLEDLYRGSTRVFDRIFNSMPNVQRISLILSQLSDIRILGHWVRAGAFRHLRTLRIELPQMPAYDFPLDTGRFDALFDGKHCMEFERMEVRVGPLYSVENGRARLQSLLGEKLHWTEC
ncbi:hypothetical protein SCHPADRAFT_997582 [Schizopora paradoxa]|uniref:Uncharacterized protein n=1 Tax=Schizopora paradoxa TaxID=27342 RepID=A0A0H2S8E8_9AGAM|nr:hypothetical protein SCHPADRAFT_997582 [Schizopora paradoxa]